MTERFDPDERAAALELDRAAALELDQAVDAALADRAPDPLLGQLAELHRAEPPAALVARVGSAVGHATRRAWLPVRVAACVLAATFMTQAAGNLFSGRWVARNLDVAFDSHAFFEGGVLLVALALVVLAGALARRWLDLAVLAGAPVGLAFGVGGASELGEFPAGGALHLSQGLAALALAVLWWHARRYVPARPAKRGYAD